MYNYTLKMDNLDGEVETFNLELRKEVEPFDYIRVEDKIVWITEVDGSELAGYEEEDDIPSYKIKQ